MASPMGGGPYPFFPSALPKLGIDFTSCKFTPPHLPPQRMATPANIILEKKGRMPPYAGDTEPRRETLPRPAGDEPLSPLGEAFPNRRKHTTRRL